MRLAVHWMGALLAGACLMAPTAAMAAPPDTLDGAISLALAGPDAIGSIPAWATGLMTRASMDYTPPSSINPYRTGEAPPVACHPSADEAALNASYCRIDQAVSYDRDLLELMAGSHGPVAPIIVLAHEWGHHLQWLLGVDAPSKARELQADCFAGLYMRYLVDENVIGASEAGEIASLVFELGDVPTSTGDWFDPAVHGQSNERREALGWGYITDDLRYCFAYPAWSEASPIDLGDGIILSIGPLAAARQTGATDWSVPMPGGTVSIQRIPAAASMSEALTAGVVARFGASVTIGPIADGWLVANGWAAGDGAEATFEGVDAAGTRMRGRALAQASGSGSALLFIAATAVGRDGSAPGAGDALLALLWGYCDPDATVTANCPPARAPIDIATPPPFAEPTSRPRPTGGFEPLPTPFTTHEGRRHAQERLYDLVPAWVVLQCKPFPIATDEDAVRNGAFAAISCDYPDSGIEEVAYYAFRSGAGLDDYFFFRLDELNGSVTNRSDACRGGHRGWTPWRHGMVACWVSRTGTRKAHVRWTDDRNGTFGILDAKDQDLVALYDWWNLWLP